MTYDINNVRYTEYMRYDMCIKRHCKKHRGRIAQGVCAPRHKARCRIFMYMRAAADIYTWYTWHTKYIKSIFHTNNLWYMYIIHITYDMYIIFITNSHIKRDLSCQRLIMSHVNTYPIPKNTYHISKEPYSELHLE